MIFLVCLFSDYKKDPYSKGDPCKSICCRNDLQSERPSPGGCYDTKVFPERHNSLFISSSHTGFMNSDAFKLYPAFFLLASFSLCRWQISTWLGISVRRRWTGRQHRTDSHRSLGTNSAASVTRACHSITTSLLSRCSPFFSNHEHQCVTVCAR